MGTLRDRVNTVLRGGVADEIPFTIYENKLPRCVVERQLRNQGLCVVNRNVPIYKVKMPNVGVKAITYNENGKTLVRTEYETPCGTIFTIAEPVGFTSWTHKREFSGPADYKPLLFMINDMQYEASYEGFRAAEEADGGDSLFRGNIGLEPMQALISGYMGTEAFCMEWFDNRDEIMKLYEALVENRRRVYQLCADSPATSFNYGGNVTPEILGLQRFADFYVPHYNEAAEILHKKGKQIGVHFDANCRMIAEAINGTKLDYIEAFTPAPDTDMTLAEARKAWPDKILWINFPSSVHLESLETIERTTEELLGQIGSAEKFIMGITEDIPEDRWQQNLLVIQKVLLRHKM